MEVDSTPTPPSTKSADEAEVDTPPFSIKPLSFTNGVLKRRPPPPVAYRECMKNHAAAIGGHAVDGCGEFMPSPSSAALTCAACGCHRNFHRRDPESPTSAAITPPFLDFRHPTLPKRFSLSPSPPAAAAARGFVGVAAEEHHPAPVTPTVENPVGRKRFRTKFSQNQKEKMLRFAVELGWKMQKSDEAAVKEFCHGIGVPKGVLKVWMHNNKNTYARKETTSSSGGGAAGIANDSMISFENSGGSGSGGSGGGGGEERKVGSNGSLFEMSENGSGGAHFHGCSSS